MSKGSKSRAKMRRKALKAARKAAQKAQYKAWAEAGIKKGSRRAVQKSKGVRLVKDNRHADRCYNVGCRVCFPNMPPAPTTNVRSA